jgi:hypothetical protein
MKQSFRLIEIVKEEVPLASPCNASLVSNEHCAMNVQFLYCTCVWLSCELGITLLFFK